MDKIGLWCKSIAALSVFSSVLNLLIPGSKLKNSFKTLTAIILTYSLFLPMLNGSLDLNSLYSLTNTEKESEVYESYEYYAVLKAAELAADENIREVLTELNIEGEWKTECEYVSDEKVSYQVTVYAKIDDEMRLKAENRIKSVLGEDITVSFVEEEINE